MVPVPPAREPARAARVRIAEELDVFEARWRVRAIALAVGFSPREAGELMLVTSELATNILKFGPPGEVEVAAIEHPEHGAGVCIVARDSGTPFADFDGVLARSSRVGEAMEWTGRGLGGGLGAVSRFTDAIRWAPEAPGKHVMVERYLRRPLRP